MSNPPSYDQTLLDRLNALKKSSIQLEPATPKLKPTKPQPSTPEIDLSARLRSLRNNSYSSSPSSSPLPVSKSQVPETKAASSTSNSKKVGGSLSTEKEDEEVDILRNPISTDDSTLDELLAELGPEFSWIIPDEPDDIQRLLNEAKGVLGSDGDKDTPVSPPPSSSKPPGRKGGKEERDDNEKGKEYLTRDLDMSVFSTGDDVEEGRKKWLEDESREAQDIVRRLLDEIEVERKEEQGKCQGDGGNDDDNEEGGEGGDLKLPSAPSELPSLPTTSTSPSKPELKTKKLIDFESDITSRMAALKGLGSSSSASNPLNLPSAPTFKPFEKAEGEGEEGGRGIRNKGFTDEEIDTWCIICNDDATVQCLGCGGDLYCAVCWKEGHMGVDVGWEERRHKWKSWKKGRQ